MKFLVKDHINKTLKVEEVNSIDDLLKYVGKGKDFCISLHRIEKTDALYKNLSPELQEAVDTIPYIITVYRDFKWTM